MEKSLGQVELSQNAMELRTLIPIAQALANFLNHVLDKAACPEPSPARARPASEDPATAMRTPGSRSRGAVSLDTESPGALIGDQEYTVEEAARFMHLATVTIRKMVRGDSPRIKSHKTNGGRRVILGKDLSQALVRVRTESNGAAEAE